MDQALLLKITFDDIPNNLRIILFFTLILINILLVLLILNLINKTIINLRKIINFEYNYIPV